MNNIIFISTMHQENGNCNADELCIILQQVNPQVIFLEALDNTYTDYDKLGYTSFGVYHKKLEIAAIQKYDIHSSFDYIPVLDNGLSELFEQKYKYVCENSQLQLMINEHNKLASTQGFEFLNSGTSMVLHEKMRTLEIQILNNPELNCGVSEDIDEYENSMMRNIITYCKGNNFEKAIFMCGSAHRQSLVEKMSKFNDEGEGNLKWIIYGD